jgi:ATP-binding cassette subfamily B protein
MNIRNYIFVVRLVLNSSKKYFILLIGISILNIGVAPTSLYLGKVILDKLISIETKSTDVILIVTLIAGVSLLTYLIGHVRTLINSLISQVISNHITRIILEKAIKLDLKYFDTPVYYEAQKNVQRTINSSWESLVFGSVEFVNSGISLIIMIGILSNLNIWIAPIAFIGALPGVIVGVYSQKKMFDFYTHQIPEMRKIDYIKNLLVSPFFAKEIKLFQNGSYFLNKYDKAFKKLYNDRKKLSISLFIKQVGATIFSNISMGGCQIYIALKALNKIITIGDYSLYNGAVGSISSYISQIFNVLNQNYQQVLLADVLTDYLNLKPGIELGEGIALKRKNDIPAIQFRNVSFKYPGSNNDVLSGIDFKIEPGEKVALVGRNGAGKTTIVKLLTRLYDVTDGKVFINDKDIKLYKPEDIYKLYSAVFQDYSKYALSVKENIAIGNLEELENIEKYESVAKEVGLDITINNLPNKYKTYITKMYDMDGHPDISIGEWQKMSIARAFFRPASIYILDEPTASLDPVVEHEIFEHFLKLTEGKTSVLITHRLSSVRTADKILFLKDGKIVEAGNHDELIQLNGEYAKLYNLQASKYYDRPTQINQNLIQCQFESMDNVIAGHIRK